MKASYFLKLAMLFKLVPTKEDRDGKLQLDLLDARFIVPNLILMSAFVAIVSFYVLEIELCAESLSKLYVLFATFGLSSVLAIDNGFIAIGIAPFVLESNLAISKTAHIITFLFPLLSFVTSNILLRDLYEDNMWILPLGCLLSAMNVISSFIYFTLSHLCVLLMNEKLVDLKEKDILRQEDIVDLILVYRSCRKGAEIPCLMLFTFSQIMLVITVFLMATPSSSTQDIIAASILSFLYVIILLVIVLKVESTYDEMAKVTAKGRDHANIFQVQSEGSNGKIKNVHVQNLEYNLTKRLEFHTKLNELCALGPVTGAGFFNIDKGTLATMVSTTLTFAVILMQWNPPSSTQ